MIRDEGNGAAAAPEQTEATPIATTGAADHQPDPLVVAVIFLLNDAVKNDRDLKKKVSAMIAAINNEPDPEDATGEQADAAGTPKQSKRFTRGR